MRKLLITSLFSLVLGGLLLTIPKVDAGNFATVFHPITGHRKVVEVGNPLAFAGGYMLETKTINFETVGDINVPCSEPQCADPSFGYSVVTRYRTTLSSSMTSSQATVPVASIETFDGHTLTMSDLGGKLYLTIEPGSSREEIVKCTAISSSQWASCTRGLAFYGTTESAVSANQKAHNAGSIVVMSNVHYVYEQLADKDAEETIGGVKTFSNLPLWGLDAVGVLPTSSAQLATKRYVDGVGAGGFTSSNIGDGKTLRANGTSPETVDVATSTAVRLESFIIDSYGKFSLNTTTGEKIDSFWNNRYNATNTKASLIVSDKATSSVAHWIGGNGTANNIDLTGGDLYVQDDVEIDGSLFFGNATGTSVSIGGDLCFPNVGNTFNCISSPVSFLASTTPSQTLRAGADTCGVNNLGTYQKVKEVRVKLPYSSESKIRVDFDFDVNGSGTAYARIYKNGVAVGTEQTDASSGAYTTLSEEISGIDNDDLIQLYVHGDGGSVQADYCNFRIYYDTKFIQATSTVELN